MNDLDRIHKQIEATIAPVRRAQRNAELVTKRVQESLRPAMAIAEEIEKITAPFRQIIEDTTRSLEPFIRQINTMAQSVAKAAERWQKENRTNILEMAARGWYPNWNTFLHGIRPKDLPIDDYMIGHLRADWNEITETILEHCPNRRHILSTAFKLHVEGNYIASIPLFHSQSDGICCESLKTFLFENNRTEEKIEELIDSGQLELTGFTSLFLEPYRLTNYHNQGIKKASEEAKGKAPNRNGIMHGHRKHLDYGTEINSLKCFSLLAFVVLTTKDIIKKDT